MIKAPGFAELNYFSCSSFDRGLTPQILSRITTGAAAKLTANQLMKYTSVQSRFACNMVALVDGLPKTLDLKEFLQAFLKFRRVFTFFLI